MAELNPPQFMQNRNDHTAQGDRLGLGGLFLRGGVRGDTDLQVLPQATPNMSVIITSGHAYVAGTQDLNQGFYHCYNDANISRSFSASSPTQSRIDLVVARVQDAFYSGTTNAWDVFVVQGTPGTPGARPSLPANCAEIAQVNIGTNATSITASNIIRSAKVMALKGSVVPVASQAERDGLPLSAGLVVFRNDTDVLEFYDGTTWKANSSNTTMQVFNGTTVTNWTKPAGVKQVRVRCVGGGGGAGGVDATSASEAAQSGGGGGGGYAEKWLTASTLPATVSVVAGAGGAAGAAGIHAGGNGSPSYFGTYCIAPGGAGSAGQDGTTGWYKAFGGVGGVPTVGDILVTGGQGGMGYPRDGNPYGNNFGGAGAGALGGGQVTGDINAGPGAAGALYGGGGAGSTGNGSDPTYAGAAGARGVVIVECYF
jgi:hypothetical protein